jgi:FkbM family methyltransferase
MSWGNSVENAFFWRGWQGHEPISMQWWLSFAADSKVILDIGANTGTFAYLAKGLAPNAEVHAFEPVARIYNFLKDNKEVSGLEVQLVNVAVAESEGTLTIYDPGGENAYSASLEPAFISGPKEEYEVIVTSVDNYCEKHKIFPDLIKIDVEGSEQRVLLGARETLSRGSCRIICEWRGDAKDSATVREMLDELSYVALEVDTLELANLAIQREHDTRNILIVPKKMQTALVRQWL